MRTLFENQNTKKHESPINQQINKTQRKQIRMKMKQHYRYYGNNNLLQLLQPAVNFYMNYQTHSHLTNKNTNTIPKPQNYYSQQNNNNNERSSSAKKKIFFITRKLSPSPNNLHSKITNTSSMITSNQQKQYQQKSTKQRKFMSQQSQSQITQIEQNLKNPQKISHQSNTYLQVDKNRSQLPIGRALQVSRGQFYEDELESIQKEVDFFRYQLEITQTKNNQLQKELLKYQDQFQLCAQSIYTLANKLFSNSHSTLQMLSKCFPTIDSKKQFRKLIQKAIHVKNKRFNFSDLQNDVTFMFKALHSALNSLNEFQQSFNLKQIQIQTHKTKIQDSSDQISFFDNQNQKIKSQCERLQNIIKLNEKKNTIQENNKKEKEYSKFQSLKQQKKQIKKFSHQSTATTQNSGEKQTKNYKNIQVQTQQKRIGSAASIHKYQSHRFYNTSNNFSPYKNNLIQSKISNHSKQQKLSATKLQQQNFQKATEKKNKFQTVKQKRIIHQKNTKPIQKKRGAPTSSYLNHLIQSQTLIKGDETVETLDFQKKDSLLAPETGNVKSQLSVRRPIHRSRSRSQQQVPSSRQKSEGKCSMNNISSRVYSTYSLNPFNKYGEKRLCNQVNTNKVRKISQLSQQSQELQERMKQLMEEQNKLKQKYKNVQKIKVSRQNKKSRQNNTSIENKNSCL